MLVKFVEIFGAKILQINVVIIDLLLSNTSLNLGNVTEWHMCIAELLRTSRAKCLYILVAHATVGRRCTSLIIIIMNLVHVEFQRIFQVDAFSNKMCIVLALCVFEIRRCLDDSILLV